MAKNSPVCEVYDIAFPIVSLANDMPPDFERGTLEG